MDPGTRQAGLSPRRADGAVAGGVFLLLFVVYLLTLLPGLGGTEDTPKFQYIGAVLGTAHDPGYPLYTMLTHAWSRVPLGTLAYRINLFSAFWGAAACACVFLALRSLGVHALTAAAVACAMGLGHTFWQHSVFAEVYTLSAALTVSAVLALLRWDETRRARWLYAAVAAASLSFGAHLIFVGSLPVFVWFVLATLRWRISWRVAAISALIVGAGVAQYGYVWVRTVQQAAHLEARAGSLRELLDVMQARQFKSLAFSDTPRTVVTRRIPAVLFEVNREMGAAASTFAVAGAALLLWRKRRTGVLLLGASAGQVVLLAMLGDVAVGPIALAAISIAWLLAGCGLDGLRTAARSPAMESLALGLGATVAVAIAATLGAANLQENNHSNDTYDTDYMRLLFDHLPPKAAIVAEHYTLDNMVEYQKVVSGRADVATSVAPTRGPIDALLHGGARVFAFGEGRRSLLHLYRFTPVELFGLTLNERLAMLEPGRIVVIAGTADPWPSLPALGIKRGAGPRSRAVIIAVKGLGVAIRTPDGFDGQVTVGAGRQLGSTGIVSPAPIDASTTGSQAEIRIEGERIVTTGRGLAVVEMGDRVKDAYTVLPERGMRVPLDMRPRALYAVEGPIPAESCIELGQGDWRALGSTGAITLIAHVDNRRPAMAGLDAYFASGAPLPVALGSFAGTGTPELAVEQFGPQPAERERLAARLAADRAPATAAITTARFVTRVGVRVNDNGDYSTFELRLNGVPAGGVGRGLVDVPAAQRVTLCGPPPEPLKPAAQAGSTELYLGPGGDLHFGRGWGRTHQTTFGFARDLAADEAELLLPLEAPAGLGVSVRLGGTADAGTAELLVNGSSQGSQRYAAGWNTLAWSSQRAPWAAGLNRVLLRVQSATRPQVRRIELDWLGAK